MEGRERKKGRLVISANNPDKTGMNDRENPACTVSCV